MFYVAGTIQGILIKIKEISSFQGYHPYRGISLYHAMHDNIIGYYAQAIDIV